MIAVIVAAVSGETTRRTSFGVVTVRLPSCVNARSTCGSMRTPPLAIALAAVTIWSGVTPI